MQLSNVLTCNICDVSDPHVCAAELLNLTYDAMPAEYVTLVVTEFGAVPPTSVPVILREYRQEPAL